jgi:hypothetical protein
MSYEPAELRVLEDLHSEWEYFFNNYLWADAEKIEQTMEHVGFSKEASVCEVRRCRKMARISEMLGV